MATSTQIEPRLQAGDTTHRPQAMLKRAVGLFRETLFVNLAATALVVTLRFSISGRVTWHSLLVGAVMALIFSICIGNLIAVAMKLASSYLTAKYSPRNLLWLTLLISAAASVGCVIASVMVVACGLFPSRAFFGLIGGSLKMSVLIGLIFGLSGFFYEKLQSELKTTQLELRTHQLEEERVRKFALAAQLSSLESRLRPHLLFNTLNSISALICEDPERAERMVERLSALLRFSLDSSERNTVPLGDEVKVMTDYLEIERVRFGSRLRFDIEIPDPLLMIEVPPFCLQTLVENSVKYAISVNRAGAEIRIGATADATMLKLTVSDNGPGFTADAIIAGHGLDTLQARLSALYGENGALDFRRAEAWTVVTVSIPLNKK